MNSISMYTSGHWLSPRVHIPSERTSFKVVRHVTLRAATPKFTQRKGSAKRAGISAGGESGKNRHNSRNKRSNRLIAYNTLTPLPEESCSEPNSRGKDYELLAIGGSGRLEGEVLISGGKNSALPILAATLLADSKTVVRNVPVIKDILNMNRVLESVGATVDRVGPGGELEIDASQLVSSRPCRDSVQALRASFLVIGPLLARTGEAAVALPGGCQIGKRAVDLHIKGLEALGAEVHVEGDYVVARAPTTVNGTVRARLKGNEYHLKYPSVGATETVMMAAVLAEGETRITNAAQEPEIEALGAFLNEMGAKVAGAGTSSITICGVDRLHGTEFTTIPDRIEAGTFLVAGAITKSALSLHPVIPAHLASTITALEAVGCQVEVDTTRNALHFSAAANLKPTDITTLPFPGFPTDLQPQFMALLTQADGMSTIEETVFESRMATAQQLQRMGANIDVGGSRSRIGGSGGRTKLQGTDVSAGDLRGAAALVLAGLAAEGVTTLEGLQHLDRGYENFEEKLRNLGADLWRIPGNSAP